jgi:8-oxo-dGTP diphosphatase
MTRKGLIVDLHVILKQGSDILMGVRKNTGFCDGMYHLPAGHLEEGETVLAGTIREAKEELGIDVRSADLELVHTMHQRSGRLSLFFEARSWSGAVTNAEPEKCESLAWVPIDRLPENSVPYARTALHLIQAGKSIGVFGWDD